MLLKAVILLGLFEPLGGYSHLARVTQGRKPPAGVYWFGRCGIWKAKWQTTRADAGGRRRSGGPTAGGFLPWVFFVASRDGDSK